jgi:hypothetical protein
MIMKTSNSVKDTVATSAILFVTLAAVFGAALNSNEARADSKAAAIIQTIEPIVIHASRISTVSMDAIVVTASRTN